MTITKEQVMALADEYANATYHRDGNHGEARAALLKAVEQLGKSAVSEPVPVVYRKWSNKWHEWEYDPLCTPDSEPLYTTPPAEAKPLITREQHFALREAFAIGAADSYFEAYPTHDNDVGRMLFERGFARGFDSHERAIETAKASST